MDINDLLMVNDELTGLPPLVGTNPKIAKTRNSSVAQVS
jgi:hypothetical protein